MKTPANLLEALTKFNDKRFALDYFVSLRWPDGVECVHCNSKRVTFLDSRSIWKCKDCRKQFSAKVGTIFEDSPISLGKWLSAIWLTANAKNGVSSCEVARSLGVTQKTAWFMVHRIREAMQTGSFRKLSGIVEADETFVGGRFDKRRHSGVRHGTGADHKTPVFGVVERGGNVVAHSLPSIHASVIREAIQATVEPGANVYTDGFSAYRKLGESYKHSYIDHGSTYVRGTVHTNNIENFWCLFKRSIKGTWVRPSPKHLDRYATDQAFRYNMRKLTDSERFVVLAFQARDRRITYQQLTHD